MAEYSTAECLLNPDWRQQHTHHMHVAYCYFGGQLVLRVTTPHIRHGCIPCISHAVDTAAVSDGELDWHRQLATSVTLNSGPTCSVSAWLQARQERLIAQVEERRRLRATVVPTDVGEVKALLRQLGQPITLFGEREVGGRMAGFLLTASEIYGIPI